MHLLNKIFDKIVCINLLERPDKKEKIKKRFNELGIEVEWFNAVKYDFIPTIIKPIASISPGCFNVNQPYEIGAALSHYTVIKQAFLQGVEKLFVFEDDALFRKDFNDKIEGYLKVVPENWDMIMFYAFMYNIEPQNVRINAKWIKAFHSWSFLSYGINRNFMDQYIKRQDARFSISDLVSYMMQEQGFNVYVTIPTLCIPNTELKSNIRNEMNYKSNPTIINMGYSTENYE